MQNTLRHTLIGSATGLISMAVVLSIQPSVAAAESTPVRMQLWSGTAPLGNGQSETNDATITIHHPAKPSGTAVVICPGGGYGGLVVGPEGHGIAGWLNEHGITGVVLEYRLPSGRPFVPLLDAQRAIRTVRANAEAWRIKPNRIGIIGFSAGGHLAATAGTHFDEGDPKTQDPVARMSCRPDFMILIYPVISMGPQTHSGSKANLLGPDPKVELSELFSNEKQVTSKTPPAFLAHAKDDTLVSPDNSRSFHASLRAHQIASEYLELPGGGHGLNGYQGPMWTAWQSKSLEWLIAQNLLSSDRR
jgi:acetyl esterase/lipase